MFLVYAFDMSLNQLIAKTPKPLLVIGVLALALALIVLSNPLKDECEIKTTLFLREVRGIITSVRNKDKTQFAQIQFWMSKCKEGNSQSACEDYLNGLKKFTSALAIFPEQCQPKLFEDNASFLKTMTDAIEVMALVAWGDKPPGGISDRSGWLTEPNLKSFCALKKTFSFLTSDEDLIALKYKIYSAYPDAWPENVTEDLRDPENRPLAFKNSANPSGKMDEKQIYERSLFSIRCDLYQ